MEIQIECKHCNIELEIKENVLLFPEKKVMEKANCPKCETEIHSGETDGWFYVNQIEKIKTNEIEIRRIVFPMP